MPKMKTNRSAAKRFKVTGTGKLKRLLPGFLLFSDLLILVLAVIDNLTHRRFCRGGNLYQVKPCLLRHPHGLMSRCCYKKGVKGIMPAIF
mgnify:CR=1 FL=1